MHLETHIKHNINGIRPAVENRKTRKKTPNSSGFYDVNFEESHTHTHTERSRRAALLLHRVCLILDIVDTQKIEWVFPFFSYIKETLVRRMSTIFGLVFVRVALSTGSHRERGIVVRVYGNKQN